MVSSPDEPAPVLTQEEEAALVEDRRKQVRAELIERFGDEWLRDEGRPN